MNSMKKNNSSNYSLAVSINFENKCFLFAFFWETMFLMICITHATSVAFIIMPLHQRALRNSKGLSNFFVRLPLRQSNKTLRSHTLINTILYKISEVQVYPSQRQRQVVTFHAAMFSRHMTSCISSFYEGILRLELRYQQACLTAL